MNCSKSFSRGAAMRFAAIVGIAFFIWQTSACARAETVGTDAGATETAEMERVTTDIETAAALVGMRPDLSAFQENVEKARAAVDEESCKSGRTEACKAWIARADEALAPLASFLKGFDLYYVGHAHLDLNWQWLWPETVRAARDMFTTVLQLMKEYPDFKFSQSQAPLYVVMEEKYPEIFEEIRKRVGEGRWELTGGSWSEGDMNMPSGEGITRSILYAKKYYREKFGKEVEVLWEPDTFGHAWTVPQIMKKSGLKYYYFCRAGRDKPLFWWEGPDGSRVMAYNLGFYNESVKARDALAPPEVEMKSGPKAGAVVYGVGDHGGGPTRRDLDKAISFHDRRFFPTPHFSTFKEYMDAVAPEGGKLPVVRDELNFVFRGCYTTHGDIKKANRKAEGALQLSETVSAVAAALGRPYNHAGFEISWRNVGFNQFHDLLDGSAIHKSYEYSKKLYGKAFGIAEQETTGALQYIGARVRVDPAKGIPVLVFNALGWERDATVEVEKSYTNAEMKETGNLLNSTAPFIVTGGITTAPAQIVAITPATDSYFVRFAFVARGVPPVGYKIFYLKRVETLVGSGVTAGGSFIENQYYRVEVDPRRGVVSRIYDKANRREVAPVGADSAVFQILTEAPDAMSAWTIGKITKTEALDREATVTVEENGPVRGALRIEQTYGRSMFIKKIVLYDGIPRIDFPCEARWREVGSPVKGTRFLKAAFPVDVKGGTATFEIPFGSIERPANGDEVPAIQWIDLSNEEYGVSILNDSKYGYDVNGNVMRASLLRGSYFPDPRPDYGYSTFTISLYAHKGGWREAGTVREAWSLNHPLAATFEVGGGTNAVMPETYSFLSLSPATLALSAVKLSEDGNRLIVRFHDTAGAAGTGSISFAPGVSAPRETDLLERVTDPNRFRLNGNGYDFSYGKFEIMTAEADFAGHQRWELKPANGWDISPAKKAAIFENQPHEKTTRTESFSPCRTQAQNPAISGNYDH